MAAWIAMSSTSPSSTSRSASMSVSRGDGPRTAWRLALAVRELRPLHRSGELLDRSVALGELPSTCAGSSAPSRARSRPPGDRACCERSPIAGVAVIVAASCGRDARRPASPTAREPPGVAVTHVAPRFDAAFSSATTSSSASDAGIVDAASSSEPGCRRRGLVTRSNVCSHLNLDQFRSPIEGVVDRLSLGAVICRRAPLDSP